MAESDKVARGSRNRGEPLFVCRSGGHRDRTFRNCRSQESGSPGRRARSGLVERNWAARLVARGRGRISALRIRHIALGRGDFASSRQSGELVALSCRGPVFPRLPHDLAAAAQAFFIAEFDRDWTTPGVDRSRFIDCRHHRGGDTVSAASRRDQRMAAPLRLDPRLWHCYRGQRNPLSSSPIHSSHAGLYRRPGDCLSRQRGALSCGLQRRGGKPFDTIGLGGIVSPFLAHFPGTDLDIHPKLREASRAQHSSDRLRMPKDRSIVKWVSVAVRTSPRRPVFQSTACRPLTPLK